jgi:hypothetical protein
LVIYVTEWADAGRLFMKVISAMHRASLIPHRPSRRDILRAMTATLVCGTALPAQAQTSASALAELYFVPGGRIGFKRPEALQPGTSTWHLLSPDQTLQVQIAEALRIDAAWDARLWDEGNRRVLVASDFVLPGFEHRHFRGRSDNRHPDYGTDTLVLRDEAWIGQIAVSTSSLGASRPSVAGGLSGHWRPVIDAVLASVRVRGALPVPQALAEHRIGLGVEGLNPRFVGDTLVLRLAPPQTPAEASGTTGAHISVPHLSLKPPGTLERREQAMNLAFEIYRQLPGSRVVAGSSCRGVVRAENRVTDSLFATTIKAFGRTRDLELSAFYTGDDRAPMLQTLERLFASLSLDDG